MRGIEVGALRAAHKHYEYKTNSDAPKVTKEQDSMKETCFSILAEGLLTWSSYKQGKFTSITKIGTYTYRLF
jgi:hypothetical protein